MRSKLCPHQTQTPDTHGIRHSDACIVKGTVLIRIRIPEVLFEMASARLRAVKMRLVLGNKGEWNDGVTCSVRVKRPVTMCKAVIVRYQLTLVSCLYGTLSLCTEDI